MNAKIPTAKHRNLRFSGQTCLWSGTDTEEEFKKNCIIFDLRKYEDIFIANNFEIKKNEFLNALFLLEYVTNYSIVLSYPLNLHPFF